MKDDTFLIDHLDLIAAGKLVVSEQEYQRLAQMLLKLGGDLRAETDAKMRSISCAADYAEEAAEAKEKLAAAQAENERLKLQIGTMSAEAGISRQLYLRIVRERDELRSKLAAERSACEELHKQIAEMVPVAEQNSFRIFDCETNEIARIAQDGTVTVFKPGSEPEAARILWDAVQSNATSMRAERDTLRARVEELEAKNARLRELLESAPCTCPNPEPGDFPHDPNNDQCYQVQVKYALAAGEGDA